MMFGRPIAITGGVFQIRAIGARVTVVVENGEALLIERGAPWKLGHDTTGAGDPGTVPGTDRNGGHHPRPPGPFGRPG